MLEYTTPYSDTAGQLPSETGSPSLLEIAERRWQLANYLSHVEAASGLHHYCVWPSGRCSEFIRAQLISMAATQKLPRDWLGGVSDAPTPIGELAARYMSANLDPNQEGTSTSNARQPSRTVEDIYGARIAELDEIAPEEEITPRPDSLQDFLNFVRSADTQLRKGALFLLDDGTYEAMWRNSKWRLSLTFLGGQRIDYVLLNRERPPNGKTGQTDFDGLRDECQRLGLESPLRE